MPKQGLLAATLVLALLTGGVWYSNREETRKEHALPAVPTNRLLAIPLDELRAITVDRGPDHVRVTLQDDGSYTITEPSKLGVDVEAAVKLFQQVSILDPDRVIIDRPTEAKTSDGKPVDLSQFGLAPPRVTITAVRKKGPPTVLLLGEVSPTGATTYAKLDGDPRIVTLAQSAVASLELGRSTMSATCLTSR